MIEAVWRRACLAPAGVVAGGPPGFLPEGIGEGGGVGGHGAGQAPVGGLDAEIAGEVAGVVAVRLRLLLPRGTRESWRNGQES